jgi:colicin import membrane protein
MNKSLHGALVFLAILCLCPAAYGQSDSKDSQDAELKFSIQMTSALNNDPKAQFLVAEMYEQGVGTPQNLRMAHLWYTKSANQKYAPAITKLASWKSETQQTDAARERAEEQKRRQSEAAAAAATAKAARERAEEQKRRQAEADAAAAATAKAARERAEEQKRRQSEAAAAAATAKAARERAEEQKRRQAEAAAAAATTTVKAAQAAETAPAAKEKQAETNRPKDKSKGTIEKTAEKADIEFKANPCNTPTAKFTSTCQ